MNDAPRSGTNPSPSRASGAGPSLSHKGERESNSRRPTMDIDISPLIVNWQFMLRAVGVTLLLSGLSILLGIAIGLVCGVLRTYGGRLFDLAIGAYVDVIRSIPVLAILVWTYFA